MNLCEIFNSLINKKKSNPSLKILQENGRNLDPNVVNVKSLKRKHCTYLVDSKKIKNKNSNTSDFGSSYVKKDESVHASEPMENPQKVEYSFHFSIEDKYFVLSDHDKKIHEFMSKLSGIKNGTSKFENCDPEIDKELRSLLSLLIEPHLFHFIEGTRKESFIINSDGACKSNNEIHNQVCLSFKKININLRKHSCQVQKSIKCVINELYLILKEISDFFYETVPDLKASNFRKTFLDEMFILVYQNVNIYLDYLNKKIISNILISFVEKDFGHSPVVNFDLERFKTLKYDIAFVILNTFSNIENINKNSGKIYENFNSKQVYDSFVEININSFCNSLLNNKFFGGFDLYLKLFLLNLSSIIYDISEQYDNCRSLSSFFTNEINNKVFGLIGIYLKELKDKEVGDKLKT